MSLWGELKRRKVVQVAAVYAVVAWLLVQIVATVEAPLNLPEWFDTTVIILLAIGFPVAVILAWAFDIGPGGIRSSAPAPGGARGSPGLFANLSQALVLVAVGFLIFDQYRPAARDDTAALAASASATSGGAAPTTTGINRFALTIIEDQPTGNSRWHVFALAPTGRRFVYQTDAGLNLRDFDALETRLVSGSENTFASPIFSPDGGSVAYFSNSGDLVRLAVDGGAPTVVVPGIRAMASGSWADDGTIFWVDDDGDIKRVPANGGDFEIIVPRTENLEQFNGPRLLPDGDSLLFSRKQRNDGWDAGEIEVQSLSTGERRTLLSGGSDARYVESGHLVYVRGDSLFGVAFDLDTLQVEGTPRELARGLSRGLATGSADYGVARDGTLAYMNRKALQRRALVWLDRDGTEHDIGIAPSNYWYAQLSPDDSKVALNGWEDGERHVWIADLARGTRQRLDFGARQATPAVWASEDRVAYGVGTELLLQRADVGGTPEILHSAEIGGGVVPSGFTPDGSGLLAVNAPPPRSTRFIPIGDAPAEPVPLLDASFSQYNATVSPDGRWLAYQSDETGRLEVFVRRYPDVDNGGPWLVSTNGGLLPAWSRNTDRPELFYLEPVSGQPGIYTMMAVPFRTETGESFVSDPPQPLFEHRFFAYFATFYSPYDVSGDGNRFLTIKDAPLEDATSATSEIVIVQNWVDELERLVPTE